MMCYFAKEKVITTIFPGEVYEYTSSFLVGCVLTLSCGESVSNTVFAAPLAKSIFPSRLIDELRSITITIFFLTGDTVSTYQDL